MSLYTIRVIRRQLSEKLNWQRGSLSACYRVPDQSFCQIADLKRIAEAVWSVGGLMLVDPSVASIYNIDCLPYADVLVCSLTKYAGYTGDVLAGLVALNAEGKAYDLLSDSVERLYAPLYNLDVRRLSEVFKHAGSRVAEMNANCQHLARFLKAQPKVKKYIQFLKIIWMWGGTTSKVRMPSVLLSVSNFRTRVLWRHFIIDYKWLKVRVLVRNLRSYVLIFT